MNLYTLGSQWHNKGVFTLKVATVKAKYITSVNLNTDFTSVAGDIQRYFRCRSV